jgi:hypothetical protein
MYKEWLVLGCKADSRLAVEITNAQRFIYILPHVGLQSVMKNLEYGQLLKH